MRITQGTFSYLPDLTDDDIAKQAAYALRNGWSLAVEHSDDVHPRNFYWDMWGGPLFDAVDPSELVDAVRACRAAVPDQYIRVVAFDRRYGRQTVAMLFIVHRPDGEPGFRLQRADRAGRQVGYTLESYAAQRPHGARYGD